MPHEHVLAQKLLAPGADIRWQAGHLACRRFAAGENFKSFVGVQDAVANEPTVIKLMGRLKLAAADILLMRSSAGRRLLQRAPCG